jgi:hypothetical protein
MKTHQRSNETAFSPHTCEIAAFTNIADFRPQTWIIGDYGHIQEVVIDDSEWWIWLISATAMLHIYIPLIQRFVDRDRQTLCELT